MSVALLPHQVRAGRALLDWSQAALSAAARVSLSTVKDFEAGRREPMAPNREAIRSALESAGVDFIEENGGGAGVRLRKTAA